MIFKVKRSPVLVAISLVVVAMPFIMLIVDKETVTNNIVPFLISLIILHMLIFARFVIKDGKLIVNFGLFRKVIPIEEIERIEYSNNPLSAPAWTLQRLGIRYGRRNALVSIPADEKAFYNKLKEINPKIKLPK